MAVKPIKVPTRDARTPITEGNLPTGEFVRWLNNVLQPIGFTLNAVVAIPEIQAALSNLDAATQAAQAAATAANNAAATVTSQANLANSYVDSNPLSAADAGTNVTVSIAPHTRVYGDGTSVAVSAGTLTGQPYATIVYVYYEDPDREGGAVAYLATTDAAIAAQLDGRHVVGNVFTPAAGEPDIDGAPVLPPGAGAIRSRNPLP